jgi:hypothetical protein
MAHGVIVLYGLNLAENFLTIFNSGVELLYISKVEVNQVVTVCNHLFEVANKVP